MEKATEKIELELTERIYKLFLEKYSGNKSAFARACKCRESTIRRILGNQQGITINLLIRISSALDTTVSELFKDLYIKKEKN
jgi:plasmid maintenance system antidote protein VapI